jgi:streptogramin lyase
MKPSTNLKQRWIWLIVVTVLLGVAALLSWIKQNTFVDCGWDAPVSAWIDENGNNIWDEGEPPLEGVQFHVNDIRNDYKDVGGRAESDWNGKAKVFVWLPGCPSARFEVYAVPPLGYKPVNDKAVQITGAGYGRDDEIQFGFVRVEGYLTPTPYISRLNCITYSRSVEDMTTAHDGIIWMVNGDGAVSYDSQSYTWRSFPASSPTPALFDQIQVGDNGAVWINDQWDEAARLQESEWTYFAGENNLVAASEPSIGNTPDGEIWFAPKAPPDILAAFNPNTDSWKVYYGSRGAHKDSDSVRLFTDGTVWRVAFGSRSEFTPPDSLDDSWKIYDRHIFSSAETRTMPLDGWIKSAKIAPDGVIWIAHSFGISRLDPANDEWYLYDLASTDGALSEAPEDIAIAPDGSVWVASGNVHSLAFQFTPSSIDYKQGVWRKYDPRDGIPDFSQIDDVEVDQDSSVWFGFDYEEVIARCTQIGP